MEIDELVGTLEALTRNHGRLHNKLAFHLAENKPISDDDLRTLVVLADAVTKSIHRVVALVESDFH
jgi:hypothetical protein